MDLLAHALCGAAICSRTGLSGGPNGLSGRRWYRDMTLWWAVFFGLLPDIVSMWIPFILHVASGSSDIFFHHFGGKWLVVYRCMHSMVIALAFTALVFCICRKLWIPSLAWLIHVACDSISHGFGKFETRPFYPFSNWAINGIPFWRNSWFVMTYWAVLIGIYICLILWRSSPVSSRR